MRWMLLLPLAACAAGGGAPAARVLSVDIQGMIFHPETLTVQKGDTVVWVNKDIVPHTATAKSAQAHWDTGNLTHGASGRYVAQQAGLVDYTCTLHPTMHATLIIKE